MPESRLQTRPIAVAAVLAGMLLAAGGGWVGGVLAALAACLALAACSPGKKDPASNLPVPDASAPQNLAAEHPAVADLPAGCPAPRRRTRQLGPDHPLLPGASARAATMP